MGNSAALLAAALSLALVSHACAGNGEVQELGQSLDKEPSVSSTSTRGATFAGSERNRRVGIVHHGRQRRVTTPDVYNSQGRLGESVKHPASKAEANMVLKLAKKTWKEGMDSKGVERMSKLNRAYGQEESGALKAAWKKGEHLIEKSAVTHHFAHPKQFAKAGAKSLMRGEEMAVHMTGDAVARVEGEESREGKEQMQAQKTGKLSKHASKDGFEPLVPDGKRELDEIKLSADITANAKKELKKKLPAALAAKKKWMAEQKVKKAKRLALAAAKKAAAKIYNKKVHVGTKKVRRTRLKKAPGSKTAAAKLPNFLQTGESGMPPSFQLPAQAEASVQGAAQRAVEENLALKAAIDANEQGSIARVEAGIHEEFASHEPHSMHTFAE